MVEQLPCICVLGAETLYFPSPKDITVPCVGILYLRNLTLVLLRIWCLGDLGVCSLDMNQAMNVYNLKLLSGFIRAAVFRAQRLRVWVLSARGV